MKRREGETAEESKEIEAQVPREEESKEVGKTECLRKGSALILSRLPLLGPFALQEPSDQQRAQISRHRLEQSDVALMS